MTFFTKNGKVRRQNTKNEEKNSSKIALHECTIWFSNKEKLDQANRKYSSMRIAKILRKELGVEIPVEIVNEVAKLSGFKSVKASPNGETLYFNISSKTFGKPLFNCKRCGKSWRAKSIHRVPRHCARCNNPYWNQEYRAESI